MIPIVDAARQLSVDRSEIDKLVSSGKLISNEDRVDLEAARYLLQIEKLEKELASHNASLNSHRAALTDIAQAAAVERFSSAWWFDWLSRLGSLLTLLATGAAALAAWFSWDTAVKSREDAKAQFKSSQERVIRSEVASSLEAVGSGQPLNISVAILEEKLRTAEIMHDVYGVFEGNWEEDGGFKAEFCRSLSDKLCVGGDPERPITMGELKNFTPFLGDFCFSERERNEAICE